MFLIDFENPVGNAFLHGLVKGLAAPANIYHSESSPVIPEIVYVTVPNRPVTESFADDWRRVGNDLHNVITHYGTSLAQ